jgi:hypothetical protein
MENNGNKILKNMKTRWMLMLDPLKRIMEKYKPFFAIMQAHQNSIQRWVKPHMFKLFFMILIFLKLVATTLILGSQPMQGA